MFFHSESSILVLHTLFVPDVGDVVVHSIYNSHDPKVTVKYDTKVAILVVCYTTIVTVSIQILLLVHTIEW